nr:hypothetical protein [Bifidobacterium catenulatum]
MNIGARNGSFNDDGTIDVRVNLCGEGDIELTCGELHIDTTLGPLDIDSLIGQLKRIRALFKSLPDEPKECGVYYGKASKGIVLLSPSGKWICFDTESENGVSAKSWPGLVRILMPGDLPLQRLSKESLDIAALRDRVEACGVSES